MSFNDTNLDDIFINELSLPFGNAKGLLQARIARLNYTVEVTKYPVQVTKYPVQVTKYPVQEKKKLINHRPIGIGIKELEEVFNRKRENLR